MPIKGVLMYFPYLRLMCLKVPIKSTCCIIKIYLFHSMLHFTLCKIIHKVKVNAMTIIFSDPLLTWNLDNITVEIWGIGIPNWWQLCDYPKVPNKQFTNHKFFIHTVFIFQLLTIDPLAIGFDNVVGVPLMCHDRTICSFSKSNLKIYLLHSM